MAWGYSGCHPYTMKCTSPIEGHNVVVNIICYKQEHPICHVDTTYNIRSQLFLIIILKVASYTLLKMLVPGQCPLDA